MYGLYTLVLSLAVLLAVPLLPLLAFFPRFRKEFWQRLGFLPRSFRRFNWVGEGSVWIHAASLGEVNAILPVARELARLLPRETFVFTCTSSSGVAQARVQFPQARTHLLLPLDLPLFLNPYLKAFQPRMVVIAETELWPNFLRMLKARRCLILVANGRLTQRSFKSYRMLFPLFNPVIRCVDTFAMQSQDDARRVLDLGAHPQRVLVAGNTKYDTAGSTKVSPAERLALRAGLGLDPPDRLLAAGSTRPGEEALVLEAFISLRRKFPGLRLLLAPRHLQRLAEVRSLLKALGLEYRLRSEAPGEKRGQPVILLDTLGELARLYSLAELALIGGSFRDFGGQNPLEPAALGVPVVFGPFMSHFSDIAAALLSAEAAAQVKAPDGLEEELQRLLARPEVLARMGEAGRREVARRSGAALKNAELAAKLLRIKTFKEDNEQWRIQSAVLGQKAQEFGDVVEKANF